MTEETVYCQWIDQLVRQSKLPEDCDFFINHFHDRCTRCPTSPQLKDGKTPEQLLASLNRTARS